MIKVFNKCVVYKFLLKKNILVNKKKKTIEKFSKDDWINLAVLVIMYKYLKKYTIESESLVATSVNLKDWFYILVIHKIFTKK